MVTAKRVTKHEARRHFESGGRVLVSEYGHEPEIAVHKLTVTHSRETAEWDDLVEMVEMWRARYPNQRYYIVPR
jgi:hypothetical protein